MANDETNQDRRFFLTAATTVVGGVGMAFGAVPFIASFQPSERTRAIGAPVEADISKIEPGQRLIFEWRGKPVWVVARSAEAIADLAGMADQLEDPASDDPQQPNYAKNTHRSIKEEYLVVVGICTHLGCSPSFAPPGGDSGLGDDWKGGFFCPCHGSMFDLAGRVFESVPAPSNLEVPPHQFLSDTLLLIGADQGDNS
jgi:ubiquinol-cytochrome c reductase iron-sulfur subunit